MVSRTFTPDSQSGGEWPLNQRAGFSTRDLTQR